MFRIVSVALLFFGLNFVLQADERTWTDRGGKYQVVATLLDFDGSEVTLKKTEDGKVVKLALDKLSLPDQVYVRKTMESLGGGSAEKTSDNPFASDDSGAAPTTQKTTVPTPPVAQPTARPATRPAARSVRPQAEEEDIEITFDQTEEVFSAEAVQEKFPQTRLAAARSVRADRAKTSWSIGPDPMLQVVSKADFQPLSIPSGISDRDTRVKESSIIFARENPDAFLWNQEVETRRRRNGTLAMLIDSTTGDVRSKGVWSAKLRSWGLSPDGTKALFTEDEGNSGFGTFLRLTIVDVAQAKMSQVRRLFPFAEMERRGADREAKIKRAAWADNEHVLVQSEDGLLALLSVSDGKAVWTLKGGSLGTPFQLSPGGKYLLAPAA